jgi:3-deoxy-manno-octulosonate cytidylyltransferase (CMP-KDO synthetase)
MASKAVGIVPARLESKRLPGKALADICGLPMIVHTCKRAMLSEVLDDIYVATDSSEIKEIAEKYNIKTILTSKNHKNSSERAGEACKFIDSDIVVNIQGDEPLLYPDHIDKITKPLIKDSSIQVSMGVTKFNKINSTSDIKAVIDSDGNLIYSSRADIPHHYMKDMSFFWKLCFIVPHRKKWLEKYLEWEPTPLELIEDNHFLRLTENGIKIKTVEVDEAKISVDTPEDLEEVRSLMEKDKIKERYLK